MNSEPRSVVVCGSRYGGASPARKEIVRQWVRSVIFALPDDCLVIVGGAKGVDFWAEEVAIELDRPVVIMRPNWEVDGRRAGFIRNRKMLDREPDLVLAFWDGTSNGTKDTIEEAKRRGIDVEVRIF